MSEFQFEPMEKQRTETKKLLSLEDMLLQGHRMSPLIGGKHVTRKCHVTSYQLLCNSYQLNTCVLYGR